MFDSKPVPAQLATAYIRTQREAYEREINAQLERVARIKKNRDGIYLIAISELLNERYNGMDEETLLRALVLIAEERIGQLTAPTDEEGRLEEESRTSQGAKLHRVPPCWCGCRDVRLHCNATLGIYTVRCLDHPVHNGGCATSAEWAVRDWVETVETRLRG